MFIKKPFVTTASFVGTGLLIFSSSYFTLPFISNMLVKAVAESLGIILSLMMLVFGLIYLYLVMRQHQKPVEKQFGSVTRMPAKDAEPAKRPMTMTG